MPNFKGHFVGGVVSFCCISAAAWLGLSYVGALVSVGLRGLVASVLGGLAPDIDIHSEGRKVLYITIAVGAWMAVLQKSNAALLIFLLILLFVRLISHRGITHNILFVVTVPWFLSVVLHHYAPWIARVDISTYIYFVGGALSHLILDYTPKRFLPKFFFASGRFNLRLFKRRRSKSKKLTS